MSGSSSLDRHRREDDANDGLAKIVQVNRTISFWPVLGMTLSLVVTGVYQATVLQQTVEQQKMSNQQLQARVNELSQEIKAMNATNTSVITDANLMKFQMNTVTNRVDGIENRVTSLERNVTIRNR